MNIRKDRRRIKSESCFVDGIEFASRTEGKYYCYLKKLRDKGEITDIKCHPKFELQPQCERFGKEYRPITYTADFLVTYADGNQVVIDVKGYGMEDAELKRKMFAYKFPNLRLFWVARSEKYSETGWIDYDELMKKRRAAKKAARENKYSRPLWK